MSRSPLWRFPAPPGGDVTLEALRRDGFVAIDLETTGLDPRRDAVVALAAIPFVGGSPQPGFVTLVNPQRPIPPDSTRIHGITDEMVADAPPFDAVLPTVDERLAGRILVGHGLAFDLEVLRRARGANGRRRIQNAALDTMRLCGALHPGWSDLALERVAPELGVSLVGRHTAEGDALIAGQLMLRLLDRADARGARTLGALLWLQESYHLS